MAKSHTNDFIDLGPTEHIGDILDPEQQHFISIKFDTPMVIIPEPDPNMTELERAVIRLEAEIRNRLDESMDMRDLEMLLTASHIFPPARSEYDGQVEAYARILDRGKFLGVFKKGFNE